jgi:CBS domain containing-hemolysin-like protein
VDDEAIVGKFHARVLEVDGMRISRVLLTPLPEPDAEEGGNGNRAENGKEEHA